MDVDRRQQAFAEWQVKNPTNELNAVYQRSSA